MVPVGAHYREVVIVSSSASTPPICTGREKNPRGFTGAALEVTESCLRAPPPTGIGVSALVPVAPSLDDDEEAAVFERAGVRLSVGYVTCL